MSGVSRTAFGRPLIGALVALSALLSACSSDGADVRATTGKTSTSVARATTSSAPSSTVTSAAPAPPASEPPAAEVVSSADVQAVQERLAELGYDIGTADGQFGGRTSYAIMAFQKMEGLSRTGDIDAELRAALPGASTPGPMVPGGPSTRVEIDLNRQVLILWTGGSLTRILPISSGNGEEYCVDGECDIAVTPPGSFRIGRKAEGLEVAPLGELWWPMYFNRGIAIHGSPSVPPYPASHGCIRIPMYAAPLLYDEVGSGTAVILVGRGPGPEGVEVPPEPEPNPVPDSTLPPEPDPDPTTATTEAPADTTSSSSSTTAPDESTEETTPK